ncbi:YALI0A20834p [Yarrowia lipolytica CLIB122]|uniref:YALI0A20834p n=1 Tax=Yarrowia lipolytica (strain CLIB 122 / E 150) TaxID=284591 RepID=Q6CGA7_YARLI|nr:YALI0A20834p [Yarrowia lipolytica CLIB122]CAG84243.1 YALI0A20834p [Yarrowia lipolytica CLIB122]|eukprot:XP_500305.1 YALI0A20834p [Yarrowia lipolytica CLIB122]
MNTLRFSKHPISCLKYTVQIKSTHDALHLHSTKTTTKMEYQERQQTPENGSQQPNGNHRIPKPWDKNFQQQSHTQQPYTPQVVKQEPPQTPSAYYTPHTRSAPGGEDMSHGQRYNGYIKQEPGLEDGAAIDPALFDMGASGTVSSVPPSAPHSGHSSRHSSPAIPSTQFQTPHVSHRNTPEATPLKLATPEATPLKTETPAVVPETPVHKIVATSSDDYDAVTSFKIAIDKIYPGCFSGTAQTLIVQSPLSYKHTFGRSWMGKKYKDSLVERPERLKATSLGVGAAIANNPGKFEIEESVRQANLSSEHVTAVHGVEYINLLEKLCLESKDKLEAGQLELPPGWPEGDIYLSPETLTALKGVVGAVERGVDALYDSDVSETLQKLSIGDTPPPEGKTSTFSQAFVNIRPPGHHCHACDPSGFCLINNAHVAIQYAAKQYGVTHAVILDFDLHHGDGSQDICWSQVNVGADTTPEHTPEPEKKHSYPSPTIGYFSVHDINSFPTELGYATPDALRNASTCLMGHGLAIWNVHLEPYETEEEFWQLYRKYCVLFEKANEFFFRAQREAREAGLEFKPLVVLSAGFDASEHEGKGMQRHSVNVPVEFYHRFSKDSAALASYYKGKLLSLLEGGYSDAALSTGVWSHLTGLLGREWNADIGSQATARDAEKVCRNKESRTRKGDNILDSLRMGKLLWPDVGLPPPPSTRTRRPRAANQT